jgi:opacity protein-like surface antigen
MKKLILATILVFSTVAFACAADAPKETKKVCIDVKGKDGNVVIDKKTKKPKQNCKTMKVHKKLEGTEVPEKKK